jgi:hypothetical protein
MTGLWARLKAWARQPDVIPIGGPWPEPWPDAPECGTFSGPICLHEMPANGRTGAVKWICGAALPCELHK